MDNSQLQDEEDFDMPAPKGHPPYEGCETGGRPKKYTTEFIESEAEALLAWLEKGKFIWFERFALERGYDPNLLSLWADENEKFSGAYEMAKARQKILLIEGGLIKKFNFNMAQLLLGHHYGIFPKQETKLSGSAENPLEFILKNVDGSSKELVDDKQE